MKKFISILMMFSILITSFSTLSIFHAEELDIIETEPILDNPCLSDAEYVPNRILVMIANTPVTENLNLYTCYSDNYVELNNQYDLALEESISTLNSDISNTVIGNYASPVKNISSVLDLNIDFTEMKLLNPSAHTNEYGLYSIEKSQNNIYSIELDDSECFEDALKTLNNNPNIEIAEPDIIHEPDALPNDEYYRYQYGLTSIHAPEVWDFETGNKNVVVGIIDTGIDGTHPDLSNNLWQNPNPNQNGYTNDIHGFEFNTRVGGIPTDSKGHGTHVAGIVGAQGNNGKGVSGVCWNISLAWLGCSDMATSNFIEALNYCNLNNIQITCNSYGSSNKSEIFEYAIDNYNGLFIASAGNTSSESLHYPSGYDCPNIISVAASDSNDNLADFSNYSPFHVDVAAPGVGIVSTYNSNGVNFEKIYKIEDKYEIKNGTSMAAPYVAGVAALIKSYRPNLSPLDLKSYICNSVRKVDSLSDKVIYGGVVDAYASLTNYLPYVNFFDTDTLYSSVRVISGETIEEPDYPVKQGYSFTGWYLNGSSEPFNFNTPITTDTVLFAGWVAVEDGMYGAEFPDYFFCKNILKKINFYNNTSKTFDSYISQDDFEWMSTQSILNVNNLNIRNLSGIEYFSGINELKCDHNKLTTLSLNSNNHPNLEIINCSYNLITELTLNGFSNQLVEFDCSANKLSNLSISQYNSLLKLKCGYNNLTSLSLSGVPDLTVLNCEANKLTTLTVANKVSLITLDCSDNFLTNLYIWSLPKLKTLDCGNNFLTYLSPSSSVPELTNLTCNNNNFNNLYLYDCTKLSYLNCRESNISTLDITNLTNITRLYCDDNNLTSLELSNLTKLKTLSCNNNKLVSLDPSRCSDLASIDCRNNNLVKLLLYNSINLKTLDCSHNKLVDLDISNTILNKLDCSYNNMKSISSVIGYEIVPSNNLSNYSANIWDNPFSDISNTNDYYYHVQYVYTNGLMNGTGSTQFSPIRSATRQEIFVVLYRIAGSPNVSGLSHPFSDVSNDSSEVSKAVKWAYNNGITNGTSATTFEPTAVMKRQDLAVTIARYINTDNSVNIPKIRTFINESTYIDYTSIDSYARDSVKLLYELGILNCTESTFSPKSNTLRHQLATIFTRLSIVLI